MAEDNQGNIRPTETDNSRSEYIVLYSLAIQFEVSSYI